jgi:hypothetical protein
MNDLERDLRELFRDEAASVDAPTLAPEPVLRRTRRRQVRTVVAGAAATMIVLVGAVIAADAIRNPTATVPANPTAYGERTATIDGITVTAPAGWTLTDDLPMAHILPATSESCSFSGSAVPVAGPGATQAASAEASDTAAQPLQSCSSSPVAMPAGIPVLQLANFALPAAGFVCDVADIERTGIPSDGVAAYVAEFPRGVATADFDRACPGSEEIVTFADTSLSTVYAAVSVVGPGASAEDAALVRDFVHTLGGTRIVASEAATAGPGFVVAAGDDGGTPWRLEAGFISLDSPDAPIGAMLVTADIDGHERCDVAPPAGEIVQRAFRLGDDAWLQWGTAPARVSAVTSVAPEGTRTDATLLPWPGGFPSFPGTPALDGSIWYAIVPSPGTIETTPLGTTTTTAAPSGQRLDAATDGSATMATGHDLGVDWELRVEQGVVTLTADGQLIGSAGSFQNGGGGQWDVDAGTFLIYQQPLSVSSMTAVIDRSDAPDVAGRWMPSTDTLGHDGRLWVLPVPGEGTGTVQVNDDLPTFVSWPTHGTVELGEVLMAGSDGTVSWGLSWASPGCVVDAIARNAGDEATISCQGPYAGGDVLVTGEAGTTRVLYVIVGPTGMTGQTADQRSMVLCNDFPPSAGSWSGSAACVAIVPVGSPAQVELADADGNPIGTPITLEPVRQ